MKMKKFINAPETITDEELIGLGLAYPDILDVDGHLVISKDLANADRVTIVTYGGSGHEPAQAGFVGKGMLDVQAVGDIFAAPNGQLVFDAMKLADKGHGVLLLTLNYAGDQLAGKQAMKLAQKAGLNVRQVVTGEEIQYDPSGEDNKRGLAGAVALYHIAAAAAREGKNLDEVAAIAQRYADSMASVTVKSTDATHPQNGMSFGDLGETDLMEIGAGQHGEGGGVRVPMILQEHRGHGGGSPVQKPGAESRRQDLRHDQRLRSHHHDGDAGAVQGHGGVLEGQGRGGRGQHGGRDSHRSGGRRLPDEHCQVGRGVYPPVGRSLPHSRLQQGISHGR